VLTRHDSHTDLAIEALKAGKHVFVEKPLAINNEQLKAISTRLAEPGSPLLMVGFNRRFAPLTGKLSGFLKDRKEPWFAHYRVNAGYLPSTHWTQDPELGGGRIIGEACHFVDLLVYLNEKPPIRVAAHALPDGGKYNQDNVSLTLTFPDGSLAVLDYLSNGDKSYPKERLEVFCGGRIAVLDDFRSLEMIDNGKRKSAKSAQDKGWVNEWIAFSNAIRGAGVPPIPYDHLIGVTKVTFAALESLRQNEPIDIG
jgi:predicted dehydrogenase